MHTLARSVIPSFRHSLHSPSLFPPSASRLSPTRPLTFILTTSSLTIVPFKLFNFPSHSLYCYRCYLWLKRLIHSVCSIQDQLVIFVPSLYQIPSMSSSGSHSKRQWEGAWPQPCTAQRMACTLSDEFLGPVNTAAAYLELSEFPSQSEDEKDRKVTLRNL